MAGLNESLGSLFNIEKLPYYRPGVQARYEGSIDKTGGNADYDWSLYEKNGEWVLLDVKGPGCILNFVQHRYPSSETPVFRFYFDGESAPRFTIDHRSFGEEYPFIEPLASRYIGPEDFGRGPIRVVRSFVPMPFLRGCRITSSVKREGYAILVRDEFSCLEFIMNRDTINWILKKLNTGGRIWSIYQRKPIKTASATRW